MTMPKMRWLAMMAAATLALTSCSSALDDALGGVKSATGQMSKVKDIAGGIESMTDIDSLGDEEPAVDADTPQPPTAAAVPPEIAALAGQGAPDLCLSLASFGPGVIMTTMTAVTMLSGTLEQLGGDDVQITDADRAEWVERAYEPFNKVAELTGVPQPISDIVDRARTEVDHVIADAHAGVYSQDLTTGLSVVENTNLTDVLDDYTAAIEVYCERE